MHPHHRCLRPVLVGLPVLAFAASGCVGTHPTTNASTAVPDGAIVTREYEQVYLTGSHIPVLVPKSPTAKMLPPISPLVILSAEDAKRAGIPLR